MKLLKIMRKVMKKKATPKNTNFNTAKKVKNDEFYTRLVDIENELKYYEQQFAGKSVILPCDTIDRYSQFWTYFHKNFNRLGLKALTATYYETHGASTGIEYDGWDDQDINAYKHFSLDGNGDFRSKEIKELVLKHDIVVTNPPFSLFKDFTELLFSTKSKFLIIGPEGAITYKKFFPHVLNNKVRSGHNKVKEFIVVSSAGFVKGKKLGNVGWWTNLNSNRVNKFIPLVKEYNEIDYPKYDNYDAINVDRTKNIPMDYYGEMGVPISFYNRYNPKQFELINISTCLPLKDNRQKFVLNGKEKYARLVIKLIR